MNGIAHTATAYYSGSPFPASRDRLVTCAAHLLSTVIGKEIPMSSKQYRNLYANPADAEALESLQHMTSWATQRAMWPERAPRKKFGALIDGFALGATAFHPAPGMLPIEAVGESLPDRPGFAAHAVRSAGAAMVRAWHACRRHRELVQATRLLRGMDDRSLQDIGLSRGDIGRAARYGRDWERWH
jgi:uncharacterized protein YjiS (DUF1127 family)